MPDERAGGEYRRTHCACGEIERKRGESATAAECESHEQNAEVCEGQRNRRERQRHGETTEDSHQQGRANDQGRVLR